MIRVVLKVAALPVFIILCIAEMIMDLGLRLYSFGAGIIYTILGLFVVLAIVMQQWYNVGIFSAMIFLMVLITFFVGVIAAVIGIWMDKLKDIITA